MISIKLLNKTDSSASFLIKGTNNAFMNAVRRTIMSDVPVLAIDEVTFYENSSIMFDEFLAHRLAMLPIKTDMKTYKEGEKVTLILEKEGPCTVYSKDIKSVDPKIEVVDKNIPLLELKKGQRIKIEMDAVMGKGREHAKFQPAIIGYKNLPVITESKPFKEMKKAAEACPTKVLEIKANKIVFTDATGCTMCGECMTIPKEKNVLKIEYDKNAFIFNIESNGTLSNKEIMEKVSQTLQEKIEALKKEINAV